MSGQRFYFVKEGIVPGRPAYHVAYIEVTSGSNAGQTLQAVEVEKYYTLTEAVMAASKLNLGLVVIPPKPVADPTPPNTDPGHPFTGGAADRVRVRH